MKLGRDPGHAVGVDEAKQIPEPLIVMPGLPVLLVLSPAQVPEAAIERHGQSLDRLITLAERGLAARDPVRHLAGHQLRQVLSVLVPVHSPDAQLEHLLVRLARRRVLLTGELRLSQPSPVIPVDWITRSHLSPQRRRFRSVTGP